MPDRRQRIRIAWVTSGSCKNLRFFSHLNITNVLYQTLFESVLRATSDLTRCSQHIRPFHTYALRRREHFQAELELYNAVNELHADTIIRSYSDFDALPARGANHGLMNIRSRIRAGSDAPCSLLFCATPTLIVPEKKKCVWLLRNDLAFPVSSLCSVESSGPSIVLEQAQASCTPSCCSAPLSDSEGKVPTFQSHSM